MIYLLAVLTVLAAIFLAWLAEMALYNLARTRTETVITLGLAASSVLLVLLFVLYAKAV